MISVLPGMAKELLTKPRCSVCEGRGQWVDCYEHPGSNCHCSGYLVTCSPCGGTGEAGWSCLNCDDEIKTPGFCPECMAANVEH